MTCCHLQHVLQLLLECSAFLSCPRPSSVCRVRASSGKASETPKLDEAAHMLVAFVNGSVTAGMVSQCDWLLPPCAPLQSRVGRVCTTIFHQLRAVSG